MAGAAGRRSIVVAALALLAAPVMSALPATQAQAQPSRPVLDEETLRREYAAYLASVEGMRTYHVRYIRVATEDEARELIARIRSGARFEDLARQHSIHAQSAASGGDLGTHAGCRWGKSTLQMLDSLKRGQIWSKPVKGTHGWGIYRLEAAGDIQPRTFAQYRDQLLSGKFEPECPWVPPVTVAPAPPAVPPAGVDIPRK